jgi:hypothetical protein
MLHIVFEVQGCDARKMPQETLARLQKEKIISGRKKINLYQYFTVAISQFSHTLIIFINYLYKKSGTANF